MESIEKFDILDDNANQLGMIRTRQEVHKNGDWHKAIHVLVINDKNEVLIQKRSSNKEKHPNMWDISCGGHVSAGESSIEGAMRELEEELGLKARKEDFKLVHRIKKSYSPKPGFLENEFQDVYLYKANVNINELILQEEEVAEVKFVTYEEFKHLIISENKDMVNRKAEYMECFKKIEGNL